MSVLALSFAGSAYAAVDLAAVEKERVARRDSILGLISGAAVPSDSILITDFGAKGDGKKDCKKAFDRAMQAAAKRGGARIVVPEGVYLVVLSSRCRNKLGRHHAEEL